MKGKKIISTIFYIIAVIFLLLYVLIEITPNLFLSELGRLFLLCGSCLFLYIGGVIKSKNENSNKAMKINLWIFFILYLILLITLTLFDPMWGRQGFNAFNWTKEGFNIYIESSVNLIPFKTIIGYVEDMFSSLLPTATIFYNLIGNVVCLMPLAFFVPLLFEKRNSTKKFLITILGVTLGIELIQFITFTGKCDIDDVILNTLGALIMYKIIEISSIKNLIRNIFLLEKNEIDKKQVCKVVISILVVVVICVGLIKVRDRYYVDELEKYNSNLNYEIEIIDDSVE